MLEHLWCLMHNTSTSSTSSGCRVLEWYDVAKHGTHMTRDWLDHIVHRPSNSRNGPPALFIRAVNKDGKLRPELRVAQGGNEIACSYYLSVSDIAPFLVVAHPTPLHPRGRYFDDNHNINNSTARN